VEGSIVVEGERVVVEALEREVAARGLGPGSKLPTERDLAILSGQGRTTVRRALEALEAEGRIVRQVGRGTFLAAAPATHPPADVRDVSPAEIFGARIAIEPQMMPLIVAAGSAADMEEIERCRRGGEATNSYREFALWGSALHRAMAAATHNRMFGRICEMLDMHGHPMWSRMLRRSSTPERLAAYKQDHQEIVAALLERDADRAQALMRRHLQRIQSNVLGEYLY